MKTFFLVSIFLAFVAICPAYAGESVPKQQIKEKINELIKRTERTDALTNEEKDILKQIYAPEEARNKNTHSQSLLSKEGKVVSRPEDFKETDVSNWSPEFVFGLLPYLAGAALLYAVLTGWLYYRGAEPNSILRLVGLPLVILSAIFLVVVGYSQEQIAPVVGLLGAIAGYLLHEGNSRKT